MSNDLLNILIIDDNPMALPLYKKYITEVLGHNVDVASVPAEAWHLAERRLYDIVICDAKIPYKHSNFGGLILADELSLRFGKDSVLVISQYIENTDIITQSIKLPFLKKPDTTSTDKWFADVLEHKMRSMHKRQFGFVAMPFGNAYLDSIYANVIKRACRKSGMAVFRVDEDPTNQNIVNKIFSMICEAHFVVFLTTQNNPNVFYEAGYSFALKKEVIMCAPTLSNLPFDVKSNVCLAYEGRVDAFRLEIEKSLRELRTSRCLFKGIANKSLQRARRKRR